ncbi:MAG: type II toxin-antitoxin system VapC family toxin, partial [Spirochaetales bacterium]|nr:type II toxin-antitoxin system VapC family toxin [Spirochaetales bacterium]MCF7939296.1 type II toxin-antitoxin system VapC family toxin [Spirochaetales bacterium]
HSPKANGTRMILADTSVWIHHFRGTTGDLSPLLEAGEVSIHPWIIGEIACGNLRNRNTILQWLSSLPSVVVAGHHEVLEFIEQHQLMGRGIGYVDAHLLASTLLTPETRLFTLDKRLQELAAELNCSHKDG